MVMVDSEKAQFKAMMKALTQLFNKPDLDIELLRIWWHKLQRFDFHIVSKAFDIWVDGNKRMPTPADILELCKSQEARHIPTMIGRKISDEDKQRNQERLHAMMKQLGWDKRIRHEDNA
jgi:hypothetical protein